jgi:hypothetical protein
MFVLLKLAYQDRRKSKKWLNNNDLLELTDTCNISNNICDILFEEERPRICNKNIKILKSRIY